MKLNGLIVLVTLIILTGCAQTDAVIVKETASDHPHRYPHVKNAGDYHVQGYVDRRSGEFVVRVLDRRERPVWVRVPRIKAEVKPAGGEPETVWIEAPDYAPFAFYDTATLYPVYRKWFAWIREAHDVEIKVWVPLHDGKTYELTFSSRRDRPVPEHSGLI